MHKYKDSVCRRRLKREVCRCTWCTAPSTSAVLEIRSTVPPRMSRDSSSFCRILLRLLSRHRPFSVWKHTHTLMYLFSGGVIKTHFRSSVLYCTSKVSFPLLSSSWTFSSARFRACSSACSLCFRVYWSQLKARVIWEKAVCEQQSVTLFHPDFKYTTYISEVLIPGAEEKLYFIQLCFFMDDER